ncbi:MAG: T9SS type A sorting domain-containing protein [Flavobacterium sp.]
MKNLLLSLVLFVSVGARSQTVLAIPTVIQVENQWCWAGCTNSILSYYGISTTQCQIAEYVRTVATWHNFGSTNCCTTASLGFNYWNYNWGGSGSMEDILMNFGSIADAPFYGALPFATINTEISAGRPFIIRWGWYSGGGHFIVGKGFDASNNVYYMNPWPGEGAKIANYNWMVNDSVHQWTHTNVLTTNPPTPTFISEAGSDNTEVKVYPNPANEKISIISKQEILLAQLFDVAGKEILTAKRTKEINLKENGISKGIYFLKISGENFSVNKKVVLE